MSLGMAQPDDPVVLTIGHSTHPYEQFAALLHGAGVTAVADVRSAPYSRRSPHFNAGPLRAALLRDGIAYSFLGRELGGRPADPHFYRDGAVDYERVADSDLFRRGLARVQSGARSYRLALMCAEQDPLDCHRCLLVSRALATRGVAVSHILPDGQLAPHAQIEERLLALAGQDGADLFASRAIRLAAAYHARAPGGRLSRR